MTIFTLDAYKNWSVSRLKLRCRLLARDNMHKDELIRSLVHQLGGYVKDQNGRDFDVIEIIPVQHREEVRRILNRTG